MESEHSPLQKSHYSLYLPGWLNYGVNEENVTLRNNAEEVNVDVELECKQSWPQIG